MVAVSVITIFHNEERFLGEAVRSVLDQTFDDWELLLVDDGSTDASADIARSYARENSDKVRYVTHPGGSNLGTGSSRQLGVENARGELLTFLDADDVLVPDAIERLVNAICGESCAAAVWGAVELWYSWEGNGNGSDCLPDTVMHVAAPVNRLISPPDLLVPLLRGRLLLPTSPSIVRASVVHQVGGFERAFRSMSEDTALWIKVVAVAPGLVIDDCLVRHRQHAGSLTARVVSAGEFHPDLPHQAGFQLATWASSYLQDTGDNYPEVRRALNDWLRRYRHPRLYWWAYRLRRLRRPARRIRAEVPGLVRSAIGRARGRGTGKITASPRLIILRDLSMSGSTTISWTIRGVKQVEVRVNQPDGPLFARAESGGSSATGKWVTDGTAFFLQDVSDDLPLTAAHTLAQVTVDVDLYWAGSILRMWAWTPGPCSGKT